MNRTDRICAYCSEFSTRATVDNDPEAVKTAAARAAGGLGHCKVHDGSMSWLNFCVNFDKDKDRQKLAARQRYVDKMMTREAA